MGFSIYLSEMTRKMLYWHEGDIIYSYSGDSTHSFMRMFYTTNKM